MRRPITLVVFVLLAFAAAGAQAHSTVHHAKALPRCQRHYVRREVRVKARRHHKLVWVKESRCVRLKAKAKKPGKPPVKTPAAPILRYTATVHPSFTQAAGDPLAVTYAYSADATSTIGTTQVDLASIGQLPAGILNFYSPLAPGQAAGLVCSMNVGGAVTVGQCPVTYQATSTYEVTTQYIPDGVSAVTDTDTETISSFATSTTEQVATVPFEDGFGYEIVVTPAVLDQNGNPPPAPQPFAITVTVEQSNGQLTEISGGSYSGAGLLLPAVGASAGFTGAGVAKLEVLLGSATTATLQVTTSYLGTEGYTGSVSQTMQTTGP